MDRTCRLVAAQAVAEVQALRDALVAKVRPALHIVYWALRLYSRHH